MLRSVTYSLVHDVAILGHLDGVDIPPRALHAKHLTVDQPYQQLTHLTLHSTG